MNRNRRVILAGLVFWVAFAYRFQAPYFHNDHFEHLSMARQMLFGDVPGRDFFDPGRPLTVLLSAAGQHIIGPTLLSEALVTMTGLAIGAAIVFWLVSAATRSVIIALLSALLVVVISPRLYSYPKVLAFSVAVLALWRYIDHPTLWRMAALSLATFFAFMMRHDFGVYVTFASLVSVIALHRASALKPLAVYALIGGVLAAPYMGWLSRDGLLAGRAAPAASLLETAQFTVHPLHLDFSHGLVHVNPVRANIAVRWKSGMDVALRNSLEQKYGLNSSMADGDGTFRYGLTNDSRDNLRMLVNDPNVIDTNGINRGAAVLDLPWWDRLGNKLGLRRIVWGPFFTAHEAEAWLYYIFWAIPLATLVIAWKVPDRLQAVKLVAVSMLGIALNAYLLRGSLDSRLPDVIIPVAIGGGCLVANWVAVIRSTRSVPVRGMHVSGLSGFLLLFWIALSTYDNTVSIGRFLTAGVKLGSLRIAAKEIGQRPIDAWAPRGSQGIKRLTRYVHECTMPNDRVLLVAYEPQVFYYSERLFAGGMAYFHTRFSSESEQATIVERLQRQRVPLVIVEESRFKRLRDDFSYVYRYLQMRFVPAGETTFIDNRSWRVFVDPTRSVVTTYDGLPCYAAGSSARMDTRSMLRI